MDRPTKPAGVPDLSVAGMTVLITGGAGGIGRALAQGFPAHGARVLAADVAPAGEEDLPCCNRG